MTHILVIDDEEQIRSFLKTLLTNAGYSVTVASEGEEGIKLYQKYNTDLVITDIVMPGKEGIATIAGLLEINPDLKIIAISGGGKILPAGYLHTAKLIGAVTTLKKPVRKDNLLKIIKELI